MDVLKRFEQLADEPVPVELGVYSMGPWSVSKLKTLERCPLQFYLAYVAKVQLPKEDEDIESYIARKTLDGLFYMIGQKEKALRDNPLSSGSKIIGDIFKK